METLVVLDFGGLHFYIFRLLINLFREF